MNMEILNNALRMAEGVDRYIKSGKNSEAQAIATYCLLPEKTFAGYRQNDKLYFLFTEFEGEEITRLSYKEDGRVCYAASRNDKVDEDTALVVWDMLQKYGVVSMDDLRADYGNSDKEQWEVVLAQLKKYQNVSILKDKISQMMKAFDDVDIPHEVEFLFIGNEKESPQKIAKSLLKFGQKYSGKAKKIGDYYHSLVKEGKAKRLSYGDFSPLYDWLKENDAISRGLSNFTKYLR